MHKINHYFPNQCLLRTVRSHGWVHLAPFAWDENDKVLLRSIQHGSQAIHLRLKSLNGGIRVTAESEFVISPATKSFVVSSAGYMLGRTVELDQFKQTARKLDKKIYNFVQLGGGRFLRGASVFEDTVKTLLTTNASWAFTQFMCKNLIAHCSGRSLGKQHDNIFPSPEDLECTPIGVFKKQCKLGYRAEYLKNIVKFFSKCPIDPIVESHSFLDALAKVKGIGPYSIRHMAVLLGSYNSIPIDSEVRAFCKGKGMSRDTSIVRYYSKWAPFDFLGYKLGRIVSRNNWIGD